MKRRLLFSVLFVFLISCRAVFAILPTVNYSSGENVEVAWDNMSPIGTLTPGNVSFSVNFGMAETGKYTVSYSIDKNTPIVNQVEVPPGQKVKRTFLINADAGIHEVSISISNSKSILYDKTETIYVIKNYTHNFMDELSGRGICVHLQRQPYVADTRKVIDLIGLSGLKVVRDDGPGSAEKEKGVYNFEYYNKYIKDFSEYGLSLYCITPYGSAMYLPERNIKVDGETYLYGPQTQNSIIHAAYYRNAEAEYLKKQQYAKLETLETWNEFNGNARNRGTKSERTAQLFTDMHKPIKIQFILNGNDDVDISTFTFHNNNKNQFYNECMRMGYYPYFDRIADHNYIPKDMFSASNSADLYSIGQMEEFTKYGGFKKIDMTECGFTTPQSAGSNLFATEEGAAEDIGKVYTIYDYYDYDDVIVYDLMNDGTQVNYTEHNFGQVTYNATPKLSYLAITNYNNQTSGAILLGEINEPQFKAGARAFAYYKDGKPVIMAWANLNDGTEQTWKLDGESVTVIDNFGNTIAEGVDSVTYGSSPVYLLGMSDKWLRNAVLNDVVIRNEKWLKDFPDIAEKIGAKEVFSNAENQLGTNITEQEVLALYDNYIELGNKIISSGKEGETEEVDVSRSLYFIFRLSERIARYYATLYSQDVPQALESDYEAGYKKARTYLDNLSIKQYSDAILHYAKDYSNNAKTVMTLEDNPSKAGAVKMFDMLARDLLTWYNEFYEIENDTNLSLQIQTPYYDRISFVNNTVNTELNLNNYSDKDFEGTICAFDEDGNKVAETPKIKVPKKGYTKSSISVKTTKPKDTSGIKFYNLAYVDNDGNILSSLRTAYEVSDVFEISVMPCESTVEDLHSVQLEIKNLTSKEQNAYITLESDDNFRFKNNTVEATLKANEVKIVELPIMSIETTKYHLYSFKYSVTDEAGNVVADSDSVLSFTNVVKTDREISIDDWEGDISDWEDAYPIYINAPQNVTEHSSWHDAECSARAFFKYDNSNLYMLVDIYDEAYLQTFAAANMWQGDSIQLSIDALNDKATSYQADDYELGFSYSYLGRDFYAWQSPIQLAGGDVDFFKIIRDDNNNFSRYLIKLDKSILSNVELADGSVIGLNIAINDCDYLSREGFYQFTKGTADSKNPSLYKNFKFINSNRGNMIEGYADSIFPISVEGSAVDEGFTDMQGHWAQQPVSALQKLGYVSGMGDGSFEPEREITRAEFFTLLSKAFELNGTEAEYTDVNDTDWYSSAFDGVEKYMPEAMTENGSVFPENKITREEAIYFIGAIYKDAHAIKNQKPDVAAFPDGDEVSDWAVPMMNAALSSKLIQGHADGYLYPHNTLTRAESAMMVYNLLMKI